MAKLKEMTSVRAFRTAGIIEPDLCYLCSMAVRFPVSIYQLGSGSAAQYQVMRWDESEGPGQAFWDWHLGAQPQFFDTPLAACVAFVESYARWCEDNGHPVAASV